MFSLIKVVNNNNNLQWYAGKLQEVLVIKNNSYIFIILFYYYTNSVPYVVGSVDSLDMLTLKQQIKREKCYVLGRFPSCRQNQ